MINQSFGTRRIYLLNTHGQVASEKDDKHCTEEDDGQTDLPLQFLHTLHTLFDGIVKMGKLYFTQFDTKKEEKEQNQGHFFYWANYDIFEEFS